MKATMLRPPVPHAWRFSRVFLLDSAVVLGVGLAVTLAESFGSAQLFPASIFLRNIVVAACAVLGWRMADIVLRTTRSDMPEPLRYGLFGIAVWLGYLIGVAITGPVFGFQQYFPADLGNHYPPALGALALLVIVAGLLLYHVRSVNGQLEQRLRSEFEVKESRVARAVEHELNPPVEIGAGDLTALARAHPVRLARTDFYDMRRLENGRLAITLADVTGERVSTSSVRSSCEAVLPFLGMRGPEVALTALNSKLCSELPPGGAVSMLYAEYDPATGQLAFANAGMPEPIVVHRDARAEEIASTGDSLPLGIRRDCRYTATTVELSPGERMLLFSDGLPEATVGTQTIGNPVLLEYARRTGTVDRLLEVVETIPGVTVSDDVTVIQLARLPQAA